MSLRPEGPLSCYLPNIITTRCLAFFKLVVLHSKMNQLRAEARVAQTELTQDEISASVQARPQPVDAHNLVWVRHDQVSGRFNQAAELYNRTMALDEKRRGKEIGRALRDLHGYLLAERQQLTEFGHLRKGEREMGGRSTIRCSAGAARTQRLEHELVTERGENTRLVEAAEADRASFATERAFITSERKKIRDATEGHQAASRAWQSYCETRLRIMHEECKEQRKEILALRERVYLLRTPGDAASQASQSTSRSASTSTSTSTSTNTSTNTNTSTSTSTSTSKSTA
ncbi:MAG: hypothetical protein M1832_000537 [Thelocarpon impressellum]|nr:MAG: hypothetical protein M1832_000537 [Thelocarpon impressellum]